MAKTFHNTIHVQGQVLTDFTEKAGKQNEIIEELFMLNCYRSMTPFEVMNLLKLKGYDYPITSVRRAITTLTDEGKLQKLNSMKEGDYGKPNHTWQYVIKENNQLTFKL